MYLSKCRAALVPALCASTVGLVLALLVAALCAPVLEPGGGCFMPNKNTDKDPLHADEDPQDDLEHLLLHGIRSQEPPVSEGNDASPRVTYTTVYRGDEEEEDEDVLMDSDVQGAFGLYAEATQDAATAGLELALGRHFACADYCNQAAEKAAQAVNLLRQGRRAMYNHDLRALAEAVGAPAEVQADMAILTPFHPEAFYAETPPEEADELISAEQASEYIQVARRVLRWARGIIL